MKRNVNDSSGNVNDLLWYVTNLKKLAERGRGFQKRGSFLLGIITPYRTV